MNFFAQGAMMNVILNTMKSNIKYKDFILLALKLVNVIVNKEYEIKKNPANFDIKIIIEVIDNILANFEYHLDMTVQISELIKNVFITTNDPEIKKFLIVVIVNNADNYHKKQVIILLISTYCYIFYNTITLYIKI